MAVLSSTSPGQLGKYVIPTVQKLNDAMKRRTNLGRGSGKSYAIKNTPANVAAINEFVLVVLLSHRKKHLLLVCRPLILKFLLLLSVVLINLILNTTLEICPRL